MSDDNKPRRYGWSKTRIAIAIGLIVLGLILALVYWGPHATDGGWSRKISCKNNLEQIGLAFRMWSDDLGNFPFNVSTNAGGTMELCAVGKSGFDTNAVAHFRVMSNELNSPKLLVCPKDTTRSAAVDFQDLNPTNISYQLRTGTNLSEANPQAILLVCPIDGNTLYCDGSVTER